MTIYSVSVLYGDYGCNCFTMSNNTKMLFSPDTGWSKSCLTFQAPLAALLLMNMPAETPVHHCPPVYTTVQHCTPLYTTLHHCTTFYTTSHHFTPLHTTSHHFTPLNNTLHPFTPIGNILRIFPSVSCVHT